MKQILIYFFILSVFFFWKKFAYADILWIECKIDWKIVYSWEGAFINNCYFINNNIIKSWDKLFSVNSLKVLDNDCFENVKNSHHFLSSYKDIYTEKLEKWKNYTFKIVTQISQNNLPNSFISWVWERWFYSNIKKDCQEFIEHVKIQEKFLDTKIEYITFWVLFILHIVVVFYFIKKLYTKKL